MKLLSIINNLFTSGYKNNPDAIIIACYFNPQRNEYRKKAFDKWFDTIKHLNYLILEGVLEGGLPEISNHISKNGSKETITTRQLFWHKETLLNKIINEIIEEGKFKYIFWLDTDVLFDNKNWLVDACKELEVFNVVQPFEYCVHLERDEENPSFEKLRKAKIGYEYAPDLSAKHHKYWRSFGANVKDNPKNAISDDYDIHGHVGFAWGARTEYLKKIGGLYDNALIGGADHIMAHAFVGQIPCSCISKSFGDLEDITEWSSLAYNFNGCLYMSGISYAKGNLFHIWHGDIEKREYYKRIKEFTPISTGKVKRDDNGFHVTDDNQVSDYFINYLTHRENIEIFMSEPTMPVGEIFNESSFEGGQFGGSGAGENWVENESSSETNYNPTFS